MADRWLLTITAPFTSPACFERVRLARSFVRVFLEEALLVHPREFKSVPAFYLPGLAWPAAAPARLSARPFLAARAEKRGVARTLAMSRRASRYEN